RHSKVEVETAGEICFVDDRPAGKERQHSRERGEALTSTDDLAADFGGARAAFARIRWRSRLSRSGCRFTVNRRLSEPWTETPIGAGHDQSVHRGVAHLAMGDEFEALGEH